MRTPPVGTLGTVHLNNFDIINMTFDIIAMMLDLNKKIQTARGSEKERIRRQTEKTDKEIDDLVYELYGITEEERKVIERTSQCEEAK